ncbi:DNA topoisomerase IB [Mariniblastus fucicola]|uniref:DNA topoisomerase n=1 Tax=Mariniblastus fucicola TaxID=980251 RepID=A0A5B9PE34_9BACT|nr:DNA topoisomerase IB [Mariniblastus fucicola]QEG24957.1 Eukaryotic DNA topoisomerase I, catalytic core [Mariniblastus fucicola]
MSGTATREQKSRRRAAKAGLIFVNDFDKGYQRRKCGRGFSYLGLNGQTLTSKQTRRRIDSLAIPPAWEDVWICPDSAGHVQARGRDEAGRLQYIYHDQWSTISAATKFDRMARFAEVLPRLRRRVRKDLRRKGLPCERIMAAVTRLLDKASLRIGNDASVAARGATTLRSNDVELDGYHVSLDFPGKSGQRREASFSDRKIAKVIRQCEEVGGQFLFTYLNEQGEPQRVASNDVNEYLQQISGEQITAKDFRTWWGSTTALASLVELDKNATKRERAAACRDAVKCAAAELGNTVAVCRESYIHPGILTAGESGELPGMVAKLSNEEVAELGIDEVRFKKLLPMLDFT